MFRNRRLGLVAIVAASFFCSAASAEVYRCEQSAAVSIDPYDISSPPDDGRNFEPREWIVDTNQGWRRLDFPDFRGACQTNNGYVVCRTDNIAFGEATLSIHPNGSSFVVVYMDYGLGALAFVGKCRID